MSESGVNLYYLIFFKAIEEQNHFLHFHQQNILKSGTVKCS